MNRSDEPVYEVVATLVLIQGAGPQRGEDVHGYENRATLGVLPPGRWRADLAAGWAGMMAMPGVEVAFTDRAGLHWVRRANGTLEEIKTSPVDYYGLDRPLPLYPPSPDQPEC